MKVFINGTKTVYLYEQHQKEVIKPAANERFVQIIQSTLCKGAFVWDQCGIRIIGIMQVSVRLAALPIPEYLDFHSSYSAPRSRIAGIYSRIYSYSRIFPNERALRRTPSGPATTVRLREVSVLWEVKLQ